MKKMNVGLRAATALTGATMLLSGCAQQAAPAEPEALVADEAVEKTDYGFAAAAGEAVCYTPVANVEGAFSFDQETITPADDMFNIFGTVLTAACAKPAFAMEKGVANYFINVGGNIKKSYSINLKDLEAKEEQKVMLCSCATGSATANVQITGVKLEDVLSLAQMETAVNTITVVGSDGYGLAMPLSYALEKKAMIVYQVNDQDVPSGTQFWVPETVAKYFTRDVVDVQLTAQAEAPTVEERSDALRAEVAIMNYADGCEFTLGDEITFEGYADDCGDAVTAVEFSLDGGETWSAYETGGACADRWVYWKFAYVPEDAGTYQLSVRAKTASGNVSPLGANLLFTVHAATML